MSSGMGHNFVTHHKDSKFNFDESFSFLVNAYGEVSLSSEFLNPEPHQQMNWFCSCVRQIRLHSKQWEVDQKQYSIALAYMLLRKACNHKGVFSAEEDRSRAAAYVIAEHILSQIPKVIRSLDNKSGAVH
jgi:hypothetical protein